MKRQHEESVRRWNNEQQPSLRPKVTPECPVSGSSRSANSRIRGSVLGDDDTVKDCKVLFNLARKEIEKSERNDIETENCLMQVYMSVFGRLQSAKERLQLQQRRHQKPDYKQAVELKSQETWILYAEGLMEVISDLSCCRSDRHDKMQRERQLLVESQFTQVMATIAGMTQSSSATALSVARDQQAEQRKINETQMKTFKREQQLVLHALDTIRRTLCSKTVADTDEIVELGCHLKIIKGSGDEKASEYSMHRELAGQKFSYLLQLIQDISVENGTLFIPGLEDDDPDTEKESNRSSKASSSDGRSSGSQPRATHLHRGTSESRHNPSGQQRTKQSTRSIRSSNKESRDTANVSGARYSGSESAKKVSGSHRTENKKYQTESRPVDRNKMRASQAFENVGNSTTKKEKQRETLVPNETKLSSPWDENQGPNQNIQSRSNESRSASCSVKTERLDKNNSICHNFTWMWGLYH